MSSMSDRFFTMAYSSMFFLFSAAFSATSALPWTGPQPTATYDADDWTPRPTSGSISGHELFRRDLFLPGSICGWIGGDYSSSVECGSSSSCVWDTARSFVGCCPISAPCSTGVYTGCVDTKSGQQTVSNPAVTTCSGTSLCYVNSFPESYHQYQCGDKDMATTVATTFFGQPTDIHVQVHTTSLNIPPPTTVATGATQAAVTGGGGTTITQKSKSSIGPIIGAVVGGIAGLILLVFLGKFLLGKRREYYNKRPIGKNSRPDSNTAFHRLPNGMPSPNPLRTPEMRLARTPTFPPPPESHNNYPAPRYISENESPARSPWSPIAHVPPRFSSKRESPFPYVPYNPTRPASPSAMTPPQAYEPLRYSPKPMSAINVFTSIEVSQREGQMMPLTPGMQQNRAMSPVAFAPNDRDNECIPMVEPRRISPVAYLPRTGAQSPSEGARNVMASELTPSPSNQSLMQETGTAREMITPSPSGSQQPLLHAGQNSGYANNRESNLSSPGLLIPREPVELPARSVKNGKRGKHNKNPSSGSSRTTKYTIIPPSRDSPPRDWQRKPVTKGGENEGLMNAANASSNKYNHIALQLAGSPSQSLALKPKTSLQSLRLQPKTSLQPKSSLQNLSGAPPPRPLRNDAVLGFPIQASPLGFGSALTAARAVSPEQKEEIAQRFRIKASSPKNFSEEVEFEEAMRKGGRKGSSDKIERLLGFVTNSSKSKPPSKDKSTPKKAKVERNGREITASPTSAYEDDFLPEHYQENRGGGGGEVEGRKRTMTTESVCSANILDPAGEDAGMGTLEFGMEFPAYEEIALQRREEEQRGGGREKGVKWRDEVASDGNLAQSLRTRGGTPPRLGTPEGLGDWGREGGWL